MSIPASPFALPFLTVSLIVVQPYFFSSHFWSPLRIIPPNLFLSIFHFRNLSRTLSNIYSWTFFQKYFTLLWRRSLSYKNQSIDLQSESMDWLLYDRDNRHERVNGFLAVGYFRENAPLWIFEKGLKYTSVGLKNSLPEKETFYLFLNTSPYMCFAEFTFSWFMFLTKTINIFLLSSIFSILAGPFVHLKLFPVASSRAIFKASQ